MDEEKGYANTFESKFVRNFIEVCYYILNIALLKQFTQLL